MLLKIRSLFGSILLFVLASMLIACGVSQAEYDATKQQLKQQDEKVQQLQQQLSAAQKAVGATPAPGGAPSSGVEVLIGAKLLPTKGPQPTATPLPSGFTPPPPPAPPVPPASFNEPLSIFIRADTVTSGSGESSLNWDAASDKAKAFCAVSSVFRRGMHLVWRFEFIDVATGKRLTDKDMDKAVVRLPNGDEIKGRFGRHGSSDDSPWFWSAAWDIPLDYPIGTLDWSIIGTSKAGKSATYKPWAVALPDRGVDSRTQIVD